MSDMDPRMNGESDSKKATRASTWTPRPPEEDVITNNQKGAPPVPIGQPGDREQGTESDGPIGAQKDR